MLSGTINITRTNTGRSVQQSVQDGRGQTSDKLEGANVWRCRVASPIAAACHRAAARGVANRIIMCNAAPRRAE